MNSGPAPREAVEAHVERVLASATFRPAERSRTLLRFIVTEALEGRADRLKDYTLGAEALGRGDDFDPRIDPIARVEASRLRARLDLYYATEGTAEPVRIVLPKGGYVPIFETRAVSSANTVASPPVALPVRRTHAAALALLAALLVVAVTTWLATRPQPAPPSAELRVEIITPATTDPASFAIAPDGRRLVFVATAGGVSSLWLRRLDDAAPQPLPGTTHASLPFWSPDGRSLGFFADGEIRALDLQTGVVRAIATALVPGGAAWSDTGVILHPIVPDGPLLWTRLDNGTVAPATMLAPGQAGHRGPVFLPDGHRFLFYAPGSPDVRGIHIGELGSTAMRRLIDADTPAAFLPPDQLLYVHQSRLLAHGFDLGTAMLVGEPVVVAEPVASEPQEGLPAISVSSTGAIAYRTGTVSALRQLVWFDREGRQVTRVGEPEARGPAYPSIAPDRRRLALQRSVSGNTDIWLVDLDRGVSSLFTSARSPDIAPVWSPRGDRIVYSSLVDGIFELFEKPLDDGDARLLLRTGQPKQATDWSRDGRHVLYRTVTTTPHVDMDIWALPVGDGGEPFAVVRTPFDERDAQFSPDAAWIAYQSNESGRAEVYLQPFNRPGGRERVSTNGGVQARWRADGRELFYLTLDGALTAVPITAEGDALKPGVPQTLFALPVGGVRGISLPRYIVSDDGARVLADTVLEQPPAPVSLILNWAPPPRRRLEESPR